ncbi:MAG: anti-sigma factor antagonist [Clostridia bacterium]|nr:anti-sigma factor antagonist [Clostridia bacterium]
MKVIIKKEGDALRIIPQGEVDQHSASDLRLKADSAVDRDAGIKRLILDFAFVSFMDSSGIGVVIGRYKKIASRGGELIIENARGSTDKLLKMSGIYSLCAKKER